MPFSSSLVGTRSEVTVVEVEPRWTMAFAAALDDLLPRYMDTRDPARFLAHPLFPVCFEWPVLVGMRQQILDGNLRADETMRGVHATHHLMLHQSIRPPQRLATRAQIVAVEQRRSGAYEVIRLDTTDDSGAMVCSSWYGSLYRGVQIDGPDRTHETVPVAHESTSAAAGPRSTKVVHLRDGLSHIYTECARIFNPIHTDPKVAEAAGLPGLILHGTATLALAVSHVVAIEANGAPERVASISGSFRAMVALPSDLTIRILSRERSDGVDHIHFDVLNDQGRAAVSNGVIGLR
jgi:acyl dehydratase